jgi:phosphohistidine phosphatase SixA
VAVYLVRHAKAGTRHRWDGDDRHRPLSKAGHDQAQAIADRLGTAGVTGLYSSPYTRCVQTLEPLAARIGSNVIVDERLAEGTPADETLELLREVGPGAVLCSHGDVIPEVIDALVSRGADVVSPPEWRKASVWVLDGEGDAIRTVAAEPPPR